jgi:membrane fusion protein (multidrug efflux system)
MKKRIFLAVVGLLVVAGLLTGIKVLQIRAMIDQGKKAVPPPGVVTTSTVRSETWDASLTAIGSLTAVQGVTIAAELPGKVVRIDFTPGAAVKKGDLLIGQDTSAEQAQLPGLDAQAKLAHTERERAARMLKDKIISQADYDKAVATYEQALSQANGVRTTIAKKTIRAPFSGRLGIRQVNLGQMLHDGDPVVTLQALNPIYVDFSLPQQQLAQLRTGLGVRVTSDALPGLAVQGRITAISPLVDAATRNIQLQATVTNQAEILRPGMFVNVSVALPAPHAVLSIPATSVLYAPYGDSVFVVADDKAHKGGKAIRQQFVRLGEKRGDFVAVTSGLKGGESIVTTGVFKLRNGQPVVVDNKLAPAFRQAPAPENN